MIDKSTAQWMSATELSNAIAATVQELHDLRSAQRNNRGNGPDAKIADAVLVEMQNFNTLTAEQMDRNVRLLMDALKGS